MAQLLLEYNADIESRNNRNGTPLHEAASNNSTKVAQLLLIHKADTEKKIFKIEHFIMLRQTIAQKLHNCYLNIMQTSRQGMKVMKHLFTRVHYTTAQKCCNCYSNIMQMLKQEMKTIKHLSILHHQVTT